LYYPSEMISSCGVGFEDVHDDVKVNACADVY
jgi:hypothetical protein